MSTVAVRRKGSVAEILLDRPAVHNAFDDTLIGELTQALRDADADAGVRAVVLSGNGSTFSAGADLNWMRGMAAASEADNRADSARLATLMRTLNFLSKPTIARVNGSAYGGGVGLVACYGSLQVKRTSCWLDLVRNRWRMSSTATICSSAVVAARRRSRPS